MAVTIFLLLIVVVLFAYYMYTKDKRFYDLINKIPGPPTVPVIGNILRYNVPTENIWDMLRSLRKEYYPIARYWIGPYPHVSLFDPDDIEILLSNPKYITKGTVYESLKPWIRTGLVTSGDKKWLHRRRILTPAFHFKILKKYLEITNNNGKKFINNLKTENKESVQNLHPLLSNFTLNVICESAMGICLDKIDNNKAKMYKSTVHTLGNIVLYRALRPYIRDWMLNSLSSLGRAQKQTLKVVHEFTNQVLTERKEYHKRSDYQILKNLNDDTEDLEDDVYIGRKKKLAMLDLLLLAQQDGQIDDEGIQEEVDTFMFAGHDTTATTLVFLLLLLAENEDIQEKAREEVIKVFTKCEGKLGITELQELNYLERCIKETLRLYPPVPSITRSLNEDIKLKNYLIPAGAQVICEIFDLHRDPNLWPEPNKFDPDRFITERINKRHPYSYIPFSAGPRNCIGQKFAMMELKSIMAHILYDFKIEPVSRIADMKLALELVIRPSKPVYAKFIRIDNNNN